jgi:hypothetical protein
MEGYSILDIKSGEVTGFSTQQSDLIKDLEKRGYVNYTEPLLSPKCWVDECEKGKYPFWGLSGHFYKIINTELTLKR